MFSRSFSTAIKPISYFRDSVLRVISPSEYRAFYPRSNESALFAFKSRIGLPASMNFDPKSNEDSEISGSFLSKTVGNVLVTKYPNLNQSRQMLESVMDQYSSTQSLDKKAKILGINQLLTGAEEPSLHPQLLSLISNIRTQLGDSKAEKFIEDYIMRDLVNWDKTVEDIKDPERMVQEIYSQPDGKQPVTRLLGESGRLSPEPVFSVGLFVGTFGGNQIVFQNKIDIGELMSHLPTDTINIIAESIGLPSLTDNVATALTQDLEYRLRDIVQEALKFMRHGKRSKLSTEDINNALKVRNLEKMYGFSTPAAVQFKPLSVGSLSTFYLDDEELDFDDIINSPMPKIPAPVSFTAHWLALEGVQPAIPQNPAPIETRIELLSRRLKSQGKYDLSDKNTEVKPLVRHVLTKELQLFYQKIAEALLSKSDELCQTAIQSIKEDYGIQQLLPYLIQFASENISKNLKDIDTVRTMLNVLEAMLRNQHFFIEPYLHQFMPPILSCLVAKKICKNPHEDHWSLRAYASALLGEICGKYNSSYETLQPRVARTLLRAFLDPLKPLTTHYGAIIGITSLGSTAIKSLLLPNMKAYITLVKPVMDDDSDSVRQMEATKCYDALKIAASTYIEAEIEKLHKTRGTADEQMQVDIEPSDIEGFATIETLFGPGVSTLSQKN